METSDVIDEEVEIGNPLKVLPIVVAHEEGISILIGIGYDGMVVRIPIDKADELIKALYAIKNNSIQLGISVRKALAEVSRATSMEK